MIRLRLPKQKPMKHHSKTLFDDDGVLRHADVVAKVFELFRKSHHYSLEAKNSGLKKSMALKINFINSTFIEEAFKIYESSSNKTGKKPHPNYFVAIAKRLYYEDLDKWSNKLYIKGSRFSKNSNLGRSI